MEEEKNRIEEVNPDETHLEEATRIVVKRVMEVLQPLLDKLGEAVEQQKKENEARKETTLADQLNKLQESAIGRLALQEQKVAERINKIQSRINQTK